MNEVVIGRVQQFEKLPAELRIEKDTYFLLKNEDQFLLVSSICPHAGQLVEIEYGELVCPMHGWTFNTHTGACLNVPSKGLESYPVIVRDDELIAQL
ncbi:Rieske (2Fe-2S) protein [Paenibacillus abyssi]|uniref:Rieske domain-containing protein n=1 Tax=Paenibacillus abyssi TaxID=1340531 RepID=A0A917FI85_9BACL|nr:Rieske (2Fe-2S) protein [Paenibacillus abyssi]GGF86727.1 hypothetical protein GCM10010916_00070 [Paenibacillus abyssi]